MPLSRNGKALIVSVMVALAGAIVVFALHQEEGLTRAILRAVVFFVPAVPAVYSLRDLVPRTSVGGVVPNDEYGWSVGKSVTLGVVGLGGAQIAGASCGAVLVVGTASLLREQGVPDELLEVLLRGVFVQTSGLFVLGAYYFVGRAIGRNCRRRGVLTVVVVPFVFFLLNMVVNTSAMGPSEYLQLLEEMDVGLWQIVVSVPVMAFMGLAGYWRGRRSRVASYVNYLLRSLPKEAGARLAEVLYAKVVEQKEKAGVVGRS